MKIEFTKKLRKKLEKRLLVAKKINARDEYIRIIALLMLANQSVDAVAKTIQVNEKSIYNWLNAFFTQGLTGLKSRPKRGRKSLLSEKQKEKLKEYLLEEPQKLGFRSGTWNSIMVRELIEQKFGIKYSRHYVCQLLRSLGLSYQKTKFANPKAGREKKIEWRENIWPNLLNKARMENAIILFEDEVGFRWSGSLGYTWAPRGSKPETKSYGICSSVKTFGVLDYFSGRFIFQSNVKKLNSKSYIEFLKTVLKRFDRKIYLIQDNAPYHNSKKLEKFFEENSRISYVSLPRYCPELNLIEYLWKNVKATLHGCFFPSVSDLASRVHKTLRMFQFSEARTAHLPSSYEDILLSLAC